VQSRWQGHATRVAYVWLYAYVFWCVFPSFLSFFLSFFLSLTTDHYALALPTPALLPCPFSPCALAHPLAISEPCPHLHTRCPCHHVPMPPCQCPRRCVAHATCARALAFSMKARWGQASGLMALAGIKKRASENTGMKGVVLEEADF